MDAAPSPIRFRLSLSSISLSKPSNCPQPPSLPKATRASMRGRSKNRKPLQRGMTRSIKAIQAVQALKQLSNKDLRSLELVRHSTFERLLKHDMIAVLREPLWQGRCDLVKHAFVYHI